MPTVLIIAGPNGAGKTTFANAVLARRPEPFEFVNADEIARRIGGGGAGRAPDLLAGREMLRLLDELTAQRRDIALETTLATRSHAHRIERWRQAGYRIELVYLRLPDVETSLARVAGRVERGGHDIPEADIRRRFPRSLEYLETVYKPLVDEWQVLRHGDQGLEVVDSWP
jgi:predicted ABC-type ATPase